MDEKLIVVKVPTDNDGLPTIDFSIVSKLLKATRKNLPAGYNIIALPF